MTRAALCVLSLGLALSAKIGRAQEPPPPPPPPQPAAPEASPTPPAAAAAPAPPLVPPPAPAPERPPSWPRIGGHFGLALSILTVDNDATTVIGRDFAQVGVTPGITVKLTEHWNIDFEFIGFSRWDLNPPGVPDKSHTIWVVDPGVVYSFGPVAAGLRLAVQIGEGVPLNFGLVPIVVLPFKISKQLSYFLELDLPIFVFGEAGTPALAGVPATAARAIGSFNVLFQTGFAF